MEARGSLAEMKKYFGTAKLTNLIADKTRRLDAKRRNLCEGIDGRPAHTPTGNERPLGFRHNPWKSRLAILEDVLAKYKEGDGPITPSTLYYIPDLARFEQEFIKVHLPWENSGKILCERCDKAWTAAWRAGQSTGVAPIDSVRTPPATTPYLLPPITIEELTVELIFQRLSNAEVLTGIRKVFPGGATMNTVRWYRSHLIHDRSPKFDRLRRGRIPPTPLRQPLNPSPSLDDTAAPLAADRTDA